MLQLLDAPDHVGAYALSGTLTEEDLDRIIADVEARLGRHERIAILVDLTGFHDITVRAGLKDLRYGFGKLGELKRFAKEAVITDRQWVAALVRIAAPIIPSIALRTFPPEEKAAALEWASDIDGKGTA
jgi:hypothetical protein